MLMFKSNKKLIKTSNITFINIIYDTKETKKTTIEKQR